MSQYTEEDLPPTMYEIEQQRHAIVTAQNERRERLRLRRANQAKGHDEPTHGTVLHVQLDGSVSKRNRAGIRFERGQRVAVNVLDVPDEEIAARQAQGQAVVNVYGAERILEDTSLHVFEAPATEEDVDALKRHASDLQHQLDTERARSAELQAMVRQARMSAKDLGDGKPSRLNAAREVKAQASATSTPAPGEHSEFGAGDPADKK